MITYLNKKLPIFLVKYCKYVAICIAVVLICLYIMKAWVLVNTIDGYHRAMFADMVKGTAHKPFVARMLVPMLIKWLHVFLPQKILTFMQNGLLPFGFEFLLKYNRLNPNLLVIWYYLIIISYILFLVGMFYFLTALYNYSSWWIGCWSLLSLLLLPITSCYYGYIYDPFTPTLFLWTFYCGYKRKSWYWPLLFLAVLHKETSVLLPMAVWLSTDENKQHSHFFVLQICLLFMVRFFISLVVFGDNNGNFVEFHLLDHNLTIFSELSIRSVFLSITFLVIAGYNLRQKPRPAIAYAAMLIPLVAMAFMFGFIDELRQYAETIPGLMALALPTVTTWLSDK